MAKQCIFRESTVYCIDESPAKRGQLDRYLYFAAATFGFATAARDFNYGQHRRHRVQRNLHRHRLRSSRHQHRIRTSPYRHHPCRCGTRLFSSPSDTNTIRSEYNFDFLYCVDPARQRALATLGGSSVANSTSRTQHTWVLTRRGSATSTASSSSTTSSQAPRDYIDCVYRTTCFHVGSAAADKKAKCSSSKSQLFIYFRHTRTLGGCAFTSLQQIHPNTRGLPSKQYQFRGVYASIYIFDSERLTPHM